MENPSRNPIVKYTSTTNYNVFLSNSLFEYLRNQKKEENTRFCLQRKFEQP